MATINYDMIYGLIADLKPDIGRVHKATAVALATFLEAAARDADGHLVIHKTTGTIADMRGRREIGAAMDHVAEGLGFTPSSEAGHLALMMLAVVHDTWAEWSHITQGQRWPITTPKWISSERIMPSGVGYPVFDDAMARAREYVYLRRNIAAAIGPVADLVTGYLWAPVNTATIRDATSRMITMSPFMRFFTAKYHTVPGPYADDVIATLRDSHPSLLASARQEINAFIEARREPNGRLSVGPYRPASWNERYRIRNGDPSADDKLAQWRTECLAPSRLKHFISIWGW